MHFNNNNNNQKINFKDKVVVVTGAGRGLGKDFAIYFATNGAKVIVNDIGISVDGEENDYNIVDTIVKHIQDLGGEAIASYESAVNGETIIQTAILNYGRIDILINNAGINLNKDKNNIECYTPEDIDKVIKCNTISAYNCSKAAWKHMRLQREGKIINIIASPIVNYNSNNRSFINATYSTSKLALLGLTQSLAYEGKQYNIQVNAVAPTAITRMYNKEKQSLINIEDTDKSLRSMLNTNKITPLISYLSHSSCRENGSIYEVAGGWIGKINISRTDGVFFEDNFTPENVRENFDHINSEKNINAMSRSNTTYYHANSTSNNTNLNNYNTSKYEENEITFNFLQEKKMLNNAKTFKSPKF